MQSFAAAALLAATAAATDCVGHRGYSAAYPENTILAMRASMEAGSQGIECDLMVGSDNEVFLMHDSSLARTTNCTGRSSFISGKYNVPYYGYIESCSADFGSFSTGELVPHLRDLLDLMMEWPDRYVLLDIKNGNPLDIMNYMRPVFDDYDYDFTSQVYIAPWQTGMLTRAAEQLPEFPTSLISSSTPSADTDVDSFNVNFNSVRSNPSFIDNAQSQNKGVYSWTINSEANMNEAFDLAIDGVLTDFIDECEAIRLSRQ